MISRVESNRLEAGSAHLSATTDGCPIFTDGFVVGQTVEGGPGDSVLIPRGAVHRFENLQSTPPGTPPNSAAIGEIMRRHGLTPAP